MRLTVGCSVLLMGACNGIDRRSPDVSAQNEAHPPLDSGDSDIEESSEFQPTENGGNEGTGRPGEPASGVPMSELDAGRDACSIGDGCCGGCGSFQQCSDGACVCALNAVLCRERCLAPGSCCENADCGTGSCGEDGLCDCSSGRFGRNCEGRFVGLGFVATSFTASEARNVSGDGAIVVGSVDDGARQLAARWAWEQDGARQGERRWNDRGRMG